MLTIPILIFIGLAFFGLLDVIHISKHTKKEDPLLCPLGFECNEVVTSKYATFLGINNDLLGMLFYQVMLVAGIASVFLPGFEYEIYTFLKVSTFGAALFSLYLTYIQAFKLKNFCLYCLFSAGFSISLFIVSFFFL